MTLKKLECHDLEKQTDSLAAYLPNGPLFISKFVNNTNMRNLLKGLSHELGRSENYFKVIQKEIIPDLTVQFLPEWERVVGIPDDCFDGQGTDDVRRRDILAKLASLGVQTAKDFEDVALLFGIVANVMSGIESNEVFPLTFPFSFPLTEEEARFTIVIEYTPAFDIFPYIFPFTLGDDSVDILQCLFNKLKPANCQVLFRAV